MFNVNFRKYVEFRRVCTTKAEKLRLQREREDLNINVIRQVYLFGGSRVNFFPSLRNHEKN